jgi:hypothetical protein
MIDMYCRYNHGADERCESCQELYEYAYRWALKCPFGKEKPIFGRCQIHCYNPNMNFKINDIMKFSGTKVISSHPILAFQHLMSSNTNVQGD